jgi:hypothetical protein
MNSEPTIKQLDTKIDHLSGKIDNLAGTVQDVLDTLNVFATNVDKRFDINDRAHAEMRADFGVVSRKSNTKLTVLVDSLVSEKALDSKTAQRILALEPFAQG